MVMGLCDMLQAGRKRPDFIGEETEEERVINEARKYWAGSCLVFMLMMVSVLPVCIGLAMTLWYPELLRNQTWEEGLCLVRGEHAADSPQALNLRSKCARRTA
jgi:hypothetical protein